MPRLKKGSEVFTISLDFRNPNENNNLEPDKAEYVPLDQFLTVISAIAAITSQDQPTVFFDFGVVSICGVSLFAMHDHLRPHTAD